MRVLAATLSAHYLEYVDWADAILEEALRVAGFYARVPDRPVISAIRVDRSRSVVGARTPLFGGTGARLQEDGIGWTTYAFAGLATRS